MTFLLAGDAPVVGIECDDGSYEKLFFNFFQNSASKVANWIIVDTLKYLYFVAVYTHLIIFITLHICVFFPSSLVCT